VLLLGACATPGDGPDSAPRAGSPAFPGIDPAVRMQALDATRLPPFDGEHQVVSEPVGAKARIDRTDPPDDLWQRVRQGFGMPDLDGPLVREKTAWYAARSDYLARTLERGSKYLYHIVDALEQRGMPTELALLPMVESSFNPMAYSRSDASGLWQFIPTTGRRYSLQQDWWYDGRRDIVASTSAALDYLSDLYALHGDWHLALASYNWGEGAVTRAIQKNAAQNLPTDYASLAMPEETRNYVPKLQALKNIISNPEPFGIVLDPIPNRPYFATVARSADIDVQLAAKLAEMPVEEFIELNPGFNRPLLRAEASPRLVLPADRVERFHANLSKHSGDTAVHWQVAGVPPAPRRIAQGRGAQIQGPGRAPQVREWHPIARAGRAHAARRSAERRRARSRQAADPVRAAAAGRRQGSHRAQGRHPVGHRAPLRPVGPGPQAVERQPAHPAARTAHRAQRIRPFDVDAKASQTEIDSYM